MAELLLVEDDPDIGDQLAEALAAQAHRVRWARTGRAALGHVARGERVDLVLLDLGLPDLDGTALCRQLRAALPDVVIVVLTARTEEIDVVLGLDAGADDYLTKPFRLAELLARVRAHLRRRAPAPAPAVTVDRLSVDPGARRAVVDGREVPLRSKEFDLLAVLVQEAGQALSRERLMSEVWDEHWSGSTKTLDMHVMSLRRKLAQAGLGGEVITTLRGYGYRYESATS
ncbi:MAG TPA: response regulator transcription factor [Mycobacteriales bacterium]|nr:response regulator transcription factor [Mycobacteriales bacterium]